MRYAPPLRGANNQKLAGLSIRSANRSGGLAISVLASSGRQQLHGAGRDPLLLSGLGVSLSFLERAPPEDRHELVRCRAVLCGDGGASFAQAVRGAVRKFGFVTPRPEFRTEPFGAERFPEFRHQERQVAAGTDIDHFLQDW